MKRKLLGLLLSITMLITLFPAAMSVYAASSGVCGANLTWTLDDEGTLTINGSGKMYDYDSFGSQASPFNQKAANIKKVIIGNDVTYIGKYAFYKCNNITSIEIGEGVKSLGGFAFYECTSLSQVNWNAISMDNLAYNGYYFNSGEGASGFDVVFGDQVERIPDHAFSGYRNSTYPRVKSIQFGSSITSIGKSAFYQCFELTSVDIPDYITSIGESAFQSCSELTSVRIGDGITTLETSLFTACHKLENIEFGKNVTSIGPYAFSYCLGLKSIDVPDSVTSISRFAFHNCKALTDVRFGEDVTTIEEGVFCNCSQLENVEFSDNITSIGRLAFGYCSSLINFDIPDSVTSIGTSAFEGCKGLTGVIIPNSVATIAEKAFYSCDNLTDAYYKGTVEQWNTISIASNNEKLTNATIHFNYHYRINSISIKDMSGNSIQSIPTETFLATVSFTKVSADVDSVIVLAQYTEDDVCEGLMYIQTEDVPIGSTMKLSIPVDNTSGAVVKLKAFCWSSFGSLTPLSNPVSFPAE